jgi:hypothetical protein
MWRMASGAALGKNVVSTARVREVFGFVACDEGAEVSAHRGEISSAVRVVFDRS